jgi:hypothetical protein
MVRKITRNKKLDYIVPVDFEIEDEIFILMSRLRKKGNFVCGIREYWIEKAIVEEICPEITKYSAIVYYTCSTTDSGEELKSKELTIEQVTLPATRIWKDKQQAEEWLELTELPLRVI